MFFLYLGASLFYLPDGLVDGFCLLGGDGGYLELTVLYLVLLKIGKFCKKILFIALL